MPPPRLCGCGECRRCKHREYMRRWYRMKGTAQKVRNRVKKYREDNLEIVREKDRARGYRVYDMEKVKARKKAASLPKQPCEVCGASKAHAHHDDHSKPLEVRWLCAEHHGEVHRVVL